MPSYRTPIDAPADIARELAKATALRYGAKAEFERLLNDRQNKILGLSEKSGPNSDTYRNAVEDLDRTKRDYARINSGVHRPLNKWRIHGLVLVAIGVLLAALEAPVNKFLFDVALRSSNLMSWAISFFFACALLALAHFAGVSLPHIWSDYRKRPVLGAILIFLVLATVLFVLVSILTVARASFSANAGTIGEMFTTVSQNVASVGLWRTLANAFSDMSALVLATINIGGIFMTLMLAFFTHDSDKDFDAASRALDRYRRKVDGISSAYIKNKEAIVKDFQPDINGVSHDFTKANQEVIELKKRLGQPLDDPDDLLLIDTLDRLAEDSRYGDDVDDPFGKGPDGEIRRAGGSAVVRPGPGLVNRKSA
jgi:succinate dehydrogenase hydrophobic anchor subunit